MPNQRDLQEMFDSLESIHDRVLLQAEREAIEALIDHPGLKVLIGLITGTRQGFYVQLANWPLVSDSSRYQAAVVQGQIKGLELIAQILLDQFPAAGDGA